MNISVTMNVLSLYLYISDSFCNLEGLVLLSVVAYYCKYSHVNAAIFC